jgi:hypothetical protein
VERPGYHVADRPGQPYIVAIYGIHQDSQLIGRKRSIHRTSPFFASRGSLLLKPTGFQGGKHGTEKQDRVA